MDRRTLALCVTILVCAISVCAQSRIDEQGVQRPTEEELAASKRLRELLRHPTFVTLRLVSSPRNFSNESPSDAPSPYTVGDWISFQLFVTQSLSESLFIENWLSPYYEYRPELYKDGDILPFSKTAQKGVEMADREPPSGSMVPANLASGREYQWIMVELKDWYERLGPGHYQLSVRKRFAWDGDWVQSNSVIFDVQARKPPTPIPASVAVEMVPENFQDKPKQKLYRLAEDLFVTVVVINNSKREINFPVVDSYYGNRPQLIKDGVLLPYTEEITKLLRFKDQNPYAVEVTLDRALPPSARIAVTNLDLKKWYGNLEPGLYKLINRHRFEIDGPWTADSPELLFEIVR